MDNPLGSLCKLWCERIVAAMKLKKEEFGDDAAEAMKFFDGPYDWLYGDGKSPRSKTGLLVSDEDGEVPSPSFQMTCNKVSELVQLFGPSLYHDNPTRVATPRKVPELPMEMFGSAMDPNTPVIYQMVMQQQAQQQASLSATGLLLEAYLNTTPYELGLKDESRLAIDEALITGLSCLWTEVYRPPGLNWKMIGSFFDSSRNLVVDPDPERMDDCKWIARRCCHPVWEVEREFGLPAGSLRGTAESHDSFAATDADPDMRDRRKRGETADLITYWKVWSKMGMGGRLRGVQPHLTQTLEMFGDYVFLAVAEHIEYPLNLPPDVIAAAPPEEVMRRVQWQTPSWMDGAWPFTPLAFHWVPGRKWPVSHIKPAMGELKFLNWAYSFLASRIKVTARQMIAIVKSADEDLRKMIRSGPDLTIIELDLVHKNINEAVQILDVKPVNKDLWDIIAAVSEQFERRTGLTELMYGESNRQMRSAQEAEVKQNQTQVRPDDMAKKVEEAMTAVAAREAAAARYHLRSADVTPLLGPVAGHFWDRLVATADPARTHRQIDCRIEAGSTRKPNRERQAANMAQAIQTLFTPLYEYAGATMDVRPVNTLIADWASSIDLDPGRYQMQPPPPPAPPAPPGGGAPA